MTRFIWRGECVPVRAYRAQAVEARCLMPGFGGARGSHVIARTLSGHQNDLWPGPHFHRTRATTRRLYTIFNCLVRDRSWWDLQRNCDGVTRSKQSIFSHLGRRCLSVSGAGYTDRNSVPFAYKVAAHLHHVGDLFGQ